ncbi:MAG: DUF4136 domain-containing protein [Rhodospirillales bacterium]|nr:DUF4136 domain-containing protein [Rhodospirillales bacterium]
MRGPASILLAAVVLGGLVACEKSQKLTPQEAAIAVETTDEMDAPDPAVAHARYDRYRWVSAQEMVRLRLGYDPTMDEDTRYVIEQAINDDLAQKGFELGQPADFAVAFSDAYIDRNTSASGWAFEGPAIEATEGVAGSQMEAYDDMEVYRSPQERFTIIFLDAHTGRLLWRASGKETLSGGKQNHTRIEAAIFRTLDDMPVPLP